MSSRARLLFGLLVLSPLLVVCSEPAPLTVLVAPAQRAEVERFFEYTPVEGLQLVDADQPAEAVDDGSGFRAAIVPTEAHFLRVSGGDGQFVIEGSPLGIQVGLAQVLEAAGYRFFHPWKTHVPQTLTPPSTSERLGEVQEPEMQVRGLHPHTLHPIESLYDFWHPSPENLEGALRTIDWVVKNRGNYIQYPGLDDILRSEATAAAWREHSKKIIDYAHSRGVRMGVGIQLFGESNLQQAFDLLDDSPADPSAEMQKRLHVLFDGLDWDEVSLSFGEFSAADPGVFVANVDLAVREMRKQKPGLAVNCPVHVGNYPELRITYMGEELLYYFLVKFASEPLTPYVHTTMFYNLFEPTGGAYLHENFFEHRDYLLDEVKRGADVAYFPESAYWIAFDNSVPIYLPLYVRSRWLDMAEIRKAAGKPVPKHTLFSSGWEWSYWQTDYATLRMNFRQPERWTQPYEEMFAPWGEDGRVMAEQLAKIGELQHDALLMKKLAPYLAGRDQLIDAGELRGIVSQPDRPSFQEVRDMSAESRDGFEANVLAPLKALADGQAEALAAIDALGSKDDPWFVETRDGIAVTVARTRFIHALYSAVVQHAKTGSDGGLVEQAKAYFDEGKAIVRRRHDALHDPDPATLLRNGKNATFYQYGYLREANTLCFWTRERIEVERMIKGSSELPPGCVL